MRVVGRGGCLSLVCVIGTYIPRCSLADPIIALTLMGTGELAHNRMRGSSGESGSVQYGRRHPGGVASSD
jgi:hypothetical protein